MTKHSVQQLSTLKISGQLLTKCQESKLHWSSRDCCTASPLFVAWASANSRGPVGWVRVYNQRFPSVGCTRRPANRHPSCCRGPVLHVLVHPREEPNTGGSTILGYQVEMVSPALQLLVPCKIGQQQAMCLASTCQETNLLPGWQMIYDGQYDPSVKQLKSQRMIPTAAKLTLLVQAM